jgi:hypothetical protein
MGCSSGLAGRSPNPTQRSSCAVVATPRSCWGAPTMSASGLLDASNPAAGRGGVGSSAAPPALRGRRGRAAASGAGGQGSPPSRTDRIDRAGRRAGRSGGTHGRATWRTRSPWVGSNAVSPAPVAAGALDRPAAPRRITGDLGAGELQELPVAGGVGPGRGLGQDPTDRADSASRRGPGRRRHHRRRLSATPTPLAAAFRLNATVPSRLRGRVPASGGLGASGRG